MSGTPGTLRAPIGRFGDNRAECTRSEAGSKAAAASRVLIAAVASAARISYQRTPPAIFLEAANADGAAKGPAIVLSPATATAVLAALQGAVAALRDGDTEHARRRPCG